MAIRVTMERHEKLPAFLVWPERRDRDMHSQQNVQGVVLAGVHAWGNYVLEHVLPRPLIPVAGRPLVTHALSWLRAEGVSSASICANSDTGILRRHLGSGSTVGINLEYYEDVMPRGPAGCVRDAVSQTDASTFVVVDATLVPNLDLSAMLRAHEESRAALTVVVINRSGADTSVGTALLEPAGIHILSPAALELIPSAGYQDIKESLIPRLYAAGKAVKTYVVDARSVPRVTGAASYLAVCNEIVERLAATEKVPAGYVRRGQARIHASARVDRSAQFIGPVLVEPGSIIEAGALIVGPTTVGEGSQVCSRAVVSRSALWQQCTVGSDAVVDYSVLTDRSEVAAGSRVRGLVCMPRQTRPSWLRRWTGRWRLLDENYPGSSAVKAVPIQEAVPVGNSEKTVEMCGDLPVTISATELRMAQRIENPDKDQRR